MRKILIISFSNLKTDPRVNRQIRFLNSFYEITTIGFNSSEIEGVTHHTIQPKQKSLTEKIISAAKLLLHFYPSYYFTLDYIKQAEQILSENEFDLIIANDPDTLPLAFKYKKNAKIIFDAHEYSPREFEDKLIWLFFFQRYKYYLCKRYIPLTDHMITVCHGIAEEYKRQFGILPEVITNAPDFEPDLSPIDNSLSPKIKIIHHGGAIDSRRIELMIETMKWVDERYELYLMLIPSQQKYYESLQLMAKEYSNVFFLPPVPMRNIAEHINQFDIGFYLLEPLSFNSLHALPNKFFEFIQARLCIVIGPSPEMAQLVKGFEMGEVADEFSPKVLADALNNLTYTKILHYKNKTDQAAYELSAENNKNALLQMVHKMLGA